MLKSNPQKSFNPHAIVIGGGATGCGVARDLTLRGFAVTLLEYGDLGSGTSSRFHGMLQSGARYAVSDTNYGAECMRERLTIGKLIPEVVEETGGLFVSLPDDPPEFANIFFECCSNARIPVEELDPNQVITQEPILSQNILRAFSVPDATIQPWRLLNLLADDIRSHGGKILTRHQVTGIDVSNGKARGVQFISVDGTQENLEADVIVNAAGPWSARIAELVGERVDMELGKGSILVFSHRIVSRAVNRCRPPTSHDIIVPTGTVSLFGTTSEVVESPDTTYVRPEEVQELLNNAETLMPHIREYRAFRAWAGVRPLYRPKSWKSDKPLPRRHSVINHGNDGVSGLFTICGGSWTTHRSMAEDVCNQVCSFLGINEQCRTATTPLSKTVNQAGKQIGWRPADNYQVFEKNQRYVAPVCECESVSQEHILNLIEHDKMRHLNDLLRRIRIGFGPCQGTFCGSRISALIARFFPNYDHNNDLCNFWTERLKGSMRTAWGEQARQIMLSDLVYREVLGLHLKIENLPTDNQR